MAETKTKAMSLREKLMRIQVELKAPKNLYNSFGKYKYRNAEGIQEALKPMEKTYNVTTILTDEMIELSGRVYVKAIATIMDCETEEMISTTAYAREADAKKGMDEAQVTGATSSYARKYALNALFLLDDTKDVDSEEYQAQSKDAKPAQAKPQAQTAPAGHSYDDIKAKYNELIAYCKENGFDIKDVAKEFGLNAKSTYEEFDNALRRLIYTKSKKEASEKVSEYPEEV
ncbi:ERF family protein [Methanobrevibacter sp.]|uniref:ERF family protein n=1 Tax=Methanobrevibacter sp. TaxID=66852 RepID=UPI00389081C6